MSSFLTLLRNCTTLSQFRQLHAQTILHAVPFHNHLLSKLADLHSPDYALTIFSHIPSPNNHSYTTLIRTLATPSPHHSLYIYTQMLQATIHPSHFTFPAVLKACDTPTLTRQLHTHILKFGFLANIVVSNSLIDSYSKHFILEYAHQVLDELPDSDVVSYNSLISGYVGCGDVQKACEVFDNMPVERTVVSWTAMIDGLGRAGMVAEMLALFREMLISTDEAQPNSTTMVCLLSACADLLAARWISTFVDVNITDRNPILSTALINMYSRCGELSKARRVFDRMESKSLVPWNAMLTGYVRCGKPEGVIQLFRSMTVAPNEITMVNLLSACASLGALDIGREAHQYLLRNGLQLNKIIVTALVDMYSKCGSIGDACLAFVKCGEKDVILWNAILLGLAVHGNGRDALAVFRSMERTETRPNDATFIGVLAACCHSGLVEEGKLNFGKMVGYGLSPKVDHYALMIDLLGRSGCLDEALELVRNMVVPPDSVIWGCLLCACRIHNNVELADQVGKYVFSLDEPGVGCCIMLSNIYSSAHRWEDVVRVQRMMKEKAMRKPAGCSWIELDGGVHKFVVEDDAHMQSVEVYVMLGRLMEQLSLHGYRPNPDFNFKFLDQG